MALTLTCNHLNGTYPLMADNDQCMIWLTLWTVDDQWTEIYPLMTIDDQYMACLTLWTVDACDTDPADPCLHDENVLCKILTLIRVAYARMLHLQGRRPIPATHLTPRGRRPIASTRLTSP